MYSPEVTAIPKDEDHLWQMIEENFEFARHVLEDYPLETLDDALESGSLPAFLRLAYKPSGQGMDQRDEYYKLGKSLLPVVRDLIDRRELSLRFFQEWGKFMFCHGMMVPYLLTEGDALASLRGAYESAAVRSSIAEKQWLAHVFALPQFAALKRNKADYEVGLFLNGIRNDDTRARLYPDGWFDKILTESGELRPKVSEKNFSLDKMDELRALSTKGLPPIPDKNS